MSEYTFPCIDHVLPNPQNTSLILHTARIHSLIKSCTKSIRYTVSYPAQADMGAYQTTPQKVEHEDSLTPTSNLYGLFSASGKAANSHEEQQVCAELNVLLHRVLIRRTHVR